MIKATVTGDVQVDMKLARIADKVRARVIRQAIRPFAEDVLRRARLKAPVRSGRLRLKYRIRNYKRSRRGVTQIGLRIGTTVPYAAWQEFGTKHHSSQKHLRPALYDYDEQYLRKAQVAVRQIIQET